MPITVTPVNDAPFVSVNTGATTSVGGTAAISNSMLNEGDIDDSGSGLTYSVTGTSNGQVELSSSPGVSATSFTQAQIDAGDVVFVHDGLSGNNGSFDYSLADGGEDGATPESGSFIIAVSNAVDDTYSTDEATTLIIDAATGLLANDGESNATLAGNTVVGFDATKDADGNALWNSSTGSVDLTLSGATYTTTPTNPLPGINAAFDFSGSGSGAIAAALHSYPEINGTQPGTLEAWINIDALSGNNIIFDTGYSGAGITLLTSGGQLIFMVEQGGVVDSVTVPAPTAGDWHHYAVVAKMNSSDKFELFVDGTLQGTARAPVTNWAPGPFGLGTTNGTAVGGNSGDLAGQIAHVRIHDEQLSAANISYHAANPGLGSATPSVAAYNTTGTLGTVTGLDGGGFQYDPNGQFESLNVGQSAADTFAYTYDDGLGNTEVASVTITVNGINDGPALATIEGIPALYTENNPGVAVTGNLSLSDIDDSNLESAEIAITSGFTFGQDVLAFTDQNGISGVYNAATGVLSLTGSASIADYETAIRSVTYHNTSDNPSATTRTVSFTINDGDLNSNTLSRGIFITPQNDAPVLSSVEPAAATFTENTPPVALTGTLILNDADDTNLESATIAITGNFVPGGQDILNFTDQSGISASYNVTNGILSLSDHGVINI